MRELLIIQRAAQATEKGFKAQLKALDKAAGNRR